MTYRYLTDLAAVLRAAGLTVIELDGWRSNGRPKTTGGFDPVGILWHHTGGTPDTREYADWMARTGPVDGPRRIFSSRSGLRFSIAVRMFS